MKVMNPQVSEDRAITLGHGLENLTREELARILIQYDIEVGFVSKRDIDKSLVNSLLKEEMEDALYQAIVSKAFNPDLEVLDGFFISFDQETKHLEPKKIQRLINKFNQVEKNYDDMQNIALVSQSDKLVKVFVTRQKTEYVHDYEKGFSQAFKRQIKANVEVYLDSGIIYIQTRSSSTYYSIRTVIQNFFRFSLDNTKFKLEKPQLRQDMSRHLLTDNPAVNFSKVDSLTIKMLDILYEFQNMKYSFSGFRVTDIKFDHEEKGNWDLTTRMDTVFLTGENLLLNKEIIEKILNHRQILEMEFIVEYNENVQGRLVKHFIEAGIGYQENYCRIFIRENESESNKNILQNAYNEIKNLFITSYDNKNLQNKDKIIKILM